MGPLPNATNGHKLPKHFPHCPIPKLQHQNLPSCHSLADLMKLQEPTCCSIHCISKQIGSNFRFTNQMIREKSNTSAICMYIMCNFIKLHWWFRIDYDIYFGIHMETHVLTIQIILYHFWSDFYNIYFYYSDHIIFFGSDSYISFYTYVIFTTRVPCLGLPSFLISNPKYTVLLLTSFMAVSR